MFQSAGLFREIACPLGVSCELLNCIFTHKGKSEEKLYNVTELQDSSRAVEEPPRKKQRVADSHVPAPKGALSTGEKVSDSSTPPGEATTSSLNAPVISVSKPPARNESVKGNGEAPATIRRKISPPPTKRSSTPLTESSKKRQAPENSEDVPESAPKRKRAEPKAEALNPRLLASPPAAHPVRLKLLKLIHEQMDRLNNELLKSKDAYWKEKLGLSRQGVITQALNEEEKAAKSNGAVYANVLKLRVVALKKMTLEAWKAERMAEEAKREKTKPKPKPDTSIVDLTVDISPQEQISLLPEFICSQDGLDKHGYVTSLPTEEEIQQARKGVESAGGWEVCDRCSSRFQVFPGRRESDGALTSGGTCTYHWGRLRPLERQVGQTGVRPKQYVCCQAEPGSKGCITASSHVFKVSEAKRLALVMPFAKTPTKGPNPMASNAVCFDCEMGYTTLGMELIRLTATNWPNGKELLDVLVRPEGEILDLNSRFSGVWPADYGKAVPMKPGRNGKFSIPKRNANISETDGSTNDKKAGVESEHSNEPLPLAPNPVVARDLLFSLTTTTTPLIGHALENDLNAVRIVHPTIIDTVLLYPHPAGLPVRYGLKVLSKQKLGINIQTGGESGHDSKEDARAAGDLLRLKVKDHWDSMKREGWSVGAGGVFLPPVAGSGKVVGQALGFSKREEKKSAEVEQKDGP